MLGLTSRAASTLVGVYQFEPYVALKASTGLALNALSMSTAALMRSPLYWIVFPMRKSTQLARSSNIGPGSTGLIQCGSQRFRPRPVTIALLSVRFATICGPGLLVNEPATVMPYGSVVDPLKRTVVVHGASTLQKRLASGESTTKHELVAFSVFCPLLI